MFHRGFRGLLSIVVGSFLCATAPVGLAVAGVGVNSIRSVTQTYGPYDLKAGGLMQMQHEEFYGVEDAFYVVGYSTLILGASGEKMPDSFHCHTTFRNQIPRDWWAWSQEHKTIDAIPFKGLFSDGHNTKLEMPEGFGVYFEKGEGLRMMPMFNNRSDQVFTASMVATIDYVSAVELEKPLRPLYSSTVNVTYPHLYMVEPGTDVKEAVFQFQYPGTIHMMAVHVHPYGKSAELINETKGESVWKAVGNRNPDGTLIDMPSYSSVSGYAFTPDESYRLRVTYENPTDVEQDAMGGIFVFFSTEDDQPPRPEGVVAPAAEEEDHSDHGHGGHQH